VDAGFVIGISPSTSLYLGGTARRTDFMLRRRNLNVSVVPFGADGDGRDLFGDLVKEGGLIRSDRTGSRRFAGFDDVWALDPDGWSDYRGFTAGLDHRDERMDFFATYTRSRTEDNWVGAAGGHPDAELDPRLPELEVPWSEGVSDFDLPHRFAAGATFRFAGQLSVGATYRLTSGLPFTPGYRRGVDVNGDGSAMNDAARVPDAGALSGLLSEWPCLEDMLGGFAVRNGCRGPMQHGLDARLALTLGSLGRAGVSLVVDGLNLIESSDGLRDTALLLLDTEAPLQISDDGSVITVPTRVNEGFGDVLLPSSMGRVLRVGIRIGG
jgi:hypothetical protein